MTTAAANAATTKRQSLAQPVCRGGAGPAWFHSGRTVCAGSGTTPRGRRPERAEGRQAHQPAADFPRPVQEPASSGFSSPPVSSPACWAKWWTAIAILAIVVLNAVIGFYQEFNAEKSIAALKKMTAPQAKVRRDGQVTSIPASGIVAGDILALEAGDLVAADARLLDSGLAQVHRVRADRRVGGGDEAARDFGTGTTFRSATARTWCSWAPASRRAPARPSSWPRR